MESIARASHKKLSLAGINTELANDAMIKDLIRCNYIKAADITDRFASIPVDPLADPNILSIFSDTELGIDAPFVANLSASVSSLA